MSKICRKLSQTIYDFHCSSFYAKHRKQEHIQAPKQRILQQSNTYFQEKQYVRSKLSFLFHIIPAQTEETHGSLER
jgi:hypothetical protein